MIIKNIKRITVFTFLFLALANVTHAQDSSVNEQAKQKATSEDAQLKEAIYKKYKREVQSYDKKEFDTLFLDFFKKQRDASVTLTQEEFYTYTIKIAIYSEKLGLLYKDQKEESQRAKQEWFDKNYSDYLNSKK